MVCTLAIIQARGMNICQFGEKEISFIPLGTEIYYMKFSAKILLLVWYVVLQLLVLSRQRFQFFSGYDPVIDKTFLTYKQADHGGFETYPFRDSVLNRVSCLDQSSSESPSCKIRLKWLIVLLFWHCIYLQIISMLILHAPEFLLFNATV